LLLDVTNSKPIYGEPFVMVIASPMAFLQGQFSQILDIWPSQLALQPICGDEKVFCQNDHFDPCSSSK
jgi:hypothetical protein